MVGAIFAVVLGYRRFFHMALSTMPQIFPLFTGVRDAGGGLVQGLQAALFVLLTSVWHKIISEVQGGEAASQSAACKADDL